MHQLLLLNHAVGDVFDRDHARAFVHNDSRQRQMVQAVLRIDALNGSLLNDQTRLQKVSPDQIAQDRIEILKNRPALVGLAA